jgi:pimeloyl-ACP methyl ester carboxylesterase
MSIRQLPAQIATLGRSARPAATRSELPDSARPIAHLGHSALVAFLHGSTGNPGQWQPHMQRLSPRYRTAAPAMLGHGGTPGWPAQPAISLRAEAEHVAHQLDREASPIHLVAHGYGAAVALHLALQQPARVRSLVLYEPMLLHVLRMRADLPVDAGVGGALSCAVQRRYETGDLHGAAWVFFDYWCGDGAWRKLPVHEQQAIAAHVPKIAAELRAALTEATPVSGYAELRIPVLLVHGERTRPTARQIVRSLARALGSAEVLEMPGADHLGAITHPETLCTLVDDFLEAQRDGAHRFAWTHVLRSRLQHAAPTEADFPPLFEAPSFP